MYILKLEKIDKELILTKTFGRQVIKANLTEKQLLSGTPAEVESRVLDILENSETLHTKNKEETIYLKDFLFGKQDIYTNKQKYTRTEINNKTVENWAYAMVDFKKTYLLGKPIQYVLLNESESKEIASLNKYARYAKKQAKDLMLYEDVLATGRGFRFTDVNDSLDSDEDKAPFEIINADAAYTEVVYSNKLGNEQLLSYIETPMEYIDSQLNEKTGKYEDVSKTYTEYTVYLRDRVIVVSDKTGEYKVIDRIPLLTKYHRITEYYTNIKRISLIELGKDLFNDINYLESMDKDDMEQFVNAIMVFTNAEIDEQGLKNMKKLGAVCINSTENKRASIDLLQGRLNATDTQTYYNRLLTSLHQILGIPRATDTGTVTSGDTGKAKMTGQGFTSAGIRIEGEQCMFEMCDMEALKCILDICRTTADSEVKELKASQVDAIFQRDNTDNLLIKTQALQNLYSCDIPRNVANAIIGLFSDPNSVTTSQEDLFGPQVSQQGTKTSENGNLLENSLDTSNKDTQNQNKEVKKIIEKDNQGQ